MTAVGCICPPRGQATCPAGNAAAPSAVGNTAAAASTGDAPKPLIAAVVPSGALMSDGSSISVTNVDPPGSWFAFNDKTAKGKMIPDGTGDFPTALANGDIHTTGKGFSDWGGGIGMNFVGADMLTPLDASGFSGISFKASGASAMHVGLATVATMPEFGQCTKCYDHFAVDVTDLSSTPKVYKFTWAQLKQSGWGAPKTKLDPKTLVGLNFTSKGPVPWDFTLDDVGFFK
jgi:hypothetical protein